MVEAEQKMKGNVRKMQNGITEIFDKLKETRIAADRLQIEITRNGQENEEY